MTKVYIFLYLVLFSLSGFAQNGDKVLKNDFQEQLEFLSPKPLSKYHNINTQILLREGGVLDISKLYEHPELLVVFGSSSGLHDFEVSLSSDAKTLIIAPRIPFSLSEEVEINFGEFVQLDTGEFLSSFEYSFFTSSQLPQSSRLDEEENLDEPADHNPQARVNPEVVTLINNSPAPGNIFFNSIIPLHYRYILDYEGSYPGLWETDSPVSGREFKINRNNLISWGNIDNDTWEIVDHSGEIIFTRSMQNGYVIDIHDFQILEDNHSFMFAYDTQIVDMSEIVEGGDPSASVEGFVIQELDEDGNLVFQWRSWDYFEITDNQYLNLTSWLLHPFHINSLEIDSDENILFSCRHIDEITKINRSTGDVMWRWGGTQNEFQNQNDNGFTYQHDARRLDNGNILLFDNGNFNEPQVSRAVEFSMDTANNTVQKVWEFIHPDNLYANSQGGCQRLPNGNTLINWGNVALDNYSTRITEVNPDGDIELEIVIEDTQTTYRAHKYDWFFTDSLGGCGDILAVNYTSDALFFNNDLCHFDLDGDGFSTENDCDDNNEDINPDMDEIPYDGIDQDCDGEDLTDVDGDGFSIADDCNDNDEEINPDAEEIPYDGIDQDCDGEDLTDVDGDGFSLDDDCNDDDESINPDAVEIPNDGIDQDCDGEDLIVGIDELENQGVSIEYSRNTQLLLVKSLTGKTYSVRVTDTASRLVYQSNLLQGESSIQLSSLTSGIYLVSIEVNSTIINKKILI